MSSLERLAIRLRNNPKLRSLAFWNHVRDLYILGLRAVTFNRGLLRTLYPGVVVRASYASRQTMEADFSITSKWNVPCLDAIQRWIKGNDQAFFFDVGANHGQFALVVSRWLDPDIKRIYAFEPHPSNRVVLQENIDLNHCHNIEIVDCALAAKPGTMTLYGESVTASLQGNSRDGRKQTGVRVDTLDSFCERTGLVPDILKIDVEGFELDVLAGAVETLKRHQDSIKVICEMHTWMWPEPDFDRKLINIVESCGLNIFSLDGTLVNRIAEYENYILAKRFE